MYTGWEQRECNFARKVTHLLKRGIVLFDFLLRLIIRNFAATIKLCCRFFFLFLSDESLQRTLLRWNEFEKPVLSFFSSLTSKTLVGIYRKICKFFYFAKHMYVVEIFDIAYII